MAIDVFKETVVTLSEATNHLPKLRGGKKLHLSTVLRWILAGKKAPDGSTVRLERVKVGGTTCTSLEALQRFFDAITGECPEVKSPAVAEREWLRRAKEAGQALDVLLGVKQK